jgi:mono/diheme cytochrome c family protein
MRVLVIIALCLPAPSFARDADPDAGRELFHAYCSACHGLRATGDGPMREVLKIPPPDLTTLATSNGGIFPVFRVVRQIDGRDLLLAHGGDMPLFGDIFDFPDTAISAETGQPILTSESIADIATWLAEIQD